MLLTASLLLALLLTWPKNSPLRTCPMLCRIAASACAVLTASAVWLGWTQQLPSAAAACLKVFTQGGLAGALFILVMLLSIAPLTVRRRLMGLRAEMSILASILTLGHNAAFGKKYFVLLFTSAADLRPEVLAAAICSVVMIAVMLPLFVTSFRSVRRRMKPKRWKQLQRMAYLFYALMPVHVLLLNFHSAREGKLTAIVNVVLYCAIFLSYGVLRFRKAIGPSVFSGAAAVSGAALGILLIALLVPAPHAAQAEVPAAAGYMDGQYTGSAIGYNGRLKVVVTISDARIESIRLKSSVEDEPYLSDAVAGIFPAVVAANSTQVDSISGATTTSSALTEAIDKALLTAQDRS